MYNNSIKYKMVQRRQSRNQQTRSRRNQQAGFPALVCDENKRKFNNVCVSVCPPGTYEEPDKLPLECSSDTFLNRTATKARLASNAIGRATVSAAKSAATATASAAKSAASATVSAAKSAASATASYARNKKAAAAAKIYQSCKAYVANYDKALLTGQDVAEVVPPNPEQIAAEVNSDMASQGVVSNDAGLAAKLRSSRRQRRRY